MGDGWSQNVAAQLLEATAVPGSDPSTGMQVKPMGGPSSVVGVMGSGA